MIILDANKPQSCTKLFIFGSVSPVLNKACIKPVWAGSSAQLSYTAHKLVPYLQIPVLASISINWLLGFLLHAGGSSPAEMCCSSQPPIFFRLCRSSSLHPVKSRLPATSLPLQVLFLAPWCSSLADFAVKLNFFFNILPCTIKQDVLLLIFVFLLSNPSNWNIMPHKWSIQTQVETRQQCPRSEQTQMRVIRFVHVHN